MSNISEQSLGDFGTKNMGIYAEEVNLARAVPDLIDGLKPVQRRIMWAASKLGKDFVKTARVVGDCIGQYHAHSDVGVSDSITTIVQSNVPTIQGRGNWGSLIDPAAAMRYTNARLSDYGWTFFQKHYIAKEVTSFVPNYDDTTVEPVSLPALLPNVLLNGGEGIGVGTTTLLPTFTPASVVEVIKRILEGEKLTPADYAKTLKFSHAHGGKLVNTPENKKAWLGLFTSSQSSVQFEATLKIDRDSKAIEIDDWPPSLHPSRLIEKLRDFPECDQAFNHKGSTGVRVEMRKDHNYAQFDKFVEKVQKATQVRRAFKINVTHRKSHVDDGKVRFETRYLSLSVPELLMAWLRERLALEKRSLEYQISEQEQAIAYTKLLIHACDHLDAVFDALRAKDSKAHLMAKLKLTDEQASQILDLKVRQLSKLDQDLMAKQLKAQETHMRQLNTWLAKPRAKIINDTLSVLEAVEKDIAFEKAKNREMSVK